MDTILMNPESESNNTPTDKPSEKELSNGANTYAAKKSIAQRMMDLALLTSNSNQLRYVLNYGTLSPTFHLSLTLIALSLTLQIVVGVYLIFWVKAGGTKTEKARKHRFVVAGVFVITFVNVLMTAFGMDGPSLPPPSQSPQLTPRNTSFNTTRSGE